jgi:hypothetical protein
MNIQILYLILYMTVSSILNIFLYSSPKYMIQFRYVVCEKMQ